MPLQQDNMRDYMKDIGKIPLVTQAEEVELGTQIRLGDREAVEKLVTANLRLVVKIAHDFKGMGLPFPDLVAEGNIGLIRAAEKFDPTRGAKFSSYAAWWIKQGMRRALTEKGKTIRIPIGSVTKILKIRRVRSEFQQSLQRDPSDHEIAARLALSERVVRRLRLVDLKTVSLQDPILSGEDGELRALVPDDKAPTPYRILDSSESAQRLDDIMEKLDPRERNILSLRFGLDGGLPHTLEEISSRIGRTRERVRQIQQRALRKLRLRLTRERTA